MIEDVSTSDADELIRKRTFMAPCAAATVTVTAAIGVPTSVGSRKGRHNITMETKTW